VDLACVATLNCGMGRASDEGGGRIEEEEDDTYKRRGPYP
jgi:hypothetical protein